jgi:hypothetical protein
MRTIGTYLPAIICGAMMLVICIPMLLRRKNHETEDVGAARQEVADLREEISRLKAKQEDNSEALDG